MFDFFEKLCDFLSDVSINYNNFSDFVKNSVFNFADAFTFVRNFSEQLPEGLQWVLPVVILYTVFDFIRGR